MQDACCEEAIPAALAGVEVLRVRLVDAQVRQPAQHHRAEAPLARRALGAEVLEELLVRQVLLVEAARVDGGRAQVVRSGDGVDVAGQMEVELFHRDHLRIPAAGRSALDAERGTEGWLAYTSESSLAEMSVKSLAQTNGSGAFAFAERSWVDSCNYNVISVGVRC